MSSHTTPDYLLAIMALPRVLRARAAIRKEIAVQDAQVGDTWAYQRNMAEASRLEGEAYAIEGSPV